MSEQGDIKQNVRDTEYAATSATGDANISVQIGTKIETLIVDSEVATKLELNKKSPYHGLIRFNFKDRDRFFGRDKLITRLFEAVNRSSLSLVLGASGSGKSSVVRAGLIPELYKSLESQTFYDFIFEPGRDPFKSLLYKGLLNSEKDYSFSESEAEIALEAKADTLTKVISTLKKDEERWLIFVDQFEELFTVCDDPEKRKNFISGLVQVAKSGNSSVKILLAMRSDFLEELSFYSELGEIVNQNNIHLVTEMYPDELRQAIKQPAARHGVVFEKGLVEQIIEEVEGQKGYLPLLQYTLNLLWESECKTLDNEGRPNIEKRILSKKSYVALEGVRGALQKHVSDIYSSLNQDEQVATKQIFLKLVNIVDTDSGSKVVSQRAYRHEFISELIEMLLNKFIEKKLLVTNSEFSSQGEFPVRDNNHLKQSATVEIAHEILLSSWDELKRWLEEEKEAIILKSWLAAETRRWQKIRLQDESKANEELLKGSRLSQFVEFRNKDAFKNLGGLTPEENEFINASIEWRDRLIKAEEERRNRELRLLEETVQEKENARKAEKKAREEAQSKSKWAISTAVIAIAALAILSYSFLKQQQSQKTLEAVFLGTDDNEMLSALPQLLTEANKFRDNVDKLPGTAYQDQKNQPEINRSFAYYRSILSAAYRLQQKIERNPEKFPRNMKEKIKQEISDPAEDSLAQMLDKYRIPELEFYLQKENKNEKFGELINGRKNEDFEGRYSKGALQTTYAILQGDSGAGADLNQNGLIDTPEEANQMPCETLKKIEELWRKYTQGRCGWFGEDNPYRDTDCGLDQDENTLTMLVIRIPNNAVDRIDQSLKKNSCH